MTKTINKVQKITPTPNEQRLNQLKQLFPECLTEGEVDAVKITEILNICKEGGGGGKMMSIHLSLKNVTALHGQARTRRFISSTRLPRQH